MRISDWSSDVCSSDLIGGKWDVIHEALSLNVALFRTTVSNEINSQDTIDGVALQTGKKRVQGVELSADRTSVVKGKSVSVRVDLGGRRFIKNTTHESNQMLHP